MKTLNSIFSRLRSLLQRHGVKREIDDELPFHLEQRTAENIAAGMAPDDVAARRGNCQAICTA